MRPQPITPIAIFFDGAPAPSTRAGTKTGATPAAMIPASPAAERRQKSSRVIFIVFSILLFPCERLYHNSPAGRYGASVTVHCSGRTGKMYCASGLGPHEAPPRPVCRRSRLRQTSARGGFSFQMRSCLSR